MLSFIHKILTIIDLKTSTLRLKLFLLTRKDFALLFFDKLFTQFKGMKIINLWIEPYSFIHSFFRYIYIYIYICVCVWLNTEDYFFFKIFK